MLSLSKIFLHNWHRFQHHVIPVEDSLYLAGHNGSGKSSVLDALQVVLIAELPRVRFNSSAQDRSTRSLDTYVRGKLGEQRYLRPGNTVAYVALEFSDKANRASPFTVGVCIEAGEGKTPERTYCMLSDALDENLFFEQGRPLTRRQLRQAFRQKRGARTYDQIGEYQADLLNRLGGLNERFFELFLRALTFQPIRNIRDFVEKWLLEEQTIDVGNLQRVQERLYDLRRTASDVDERCVALLAIVDQQSEVCRLRDFHAQYSLLVFLLDVALRQREITALDERRRQLQNQIAQGEEERARSGAALEQARRALFETQVQLRQSDIARRRDELQREIETITREAQAISTRRAQLFRDLRAEVNTLQRALVNAQLLPGENEALRAFLQNVSALDSNAPPAETLRDALAHAAPALETAAMRAQEQAFKFKQQIDEFKTRGRQIERELSHLRQGGAAAYGENVERVRDILANTLGARPALLCEQLEIPAARWQDAVEAMLGARRFTLLVAPEHFDAALRVLDELRAREKIYDVRLLDTAKVSSEARPARPNSLALQVTTNDTALRAYLDTVLGDIITCETVNELRQHRRAVTPQVMMYSEWTVRAVSPRDYTPWFIGERAQHSQIQARERELNELHAQFTALAPQANQAEAQAKQLQRGVALAVLGERLDAPLDDRMLREHMAAAQTELDALDLSGIRALELEAARLEGIVKREEQTEKEWITKIARWDAETNQVQQQLQNAQRARDEAQLQADAARQQNPNASGSAQELLEQRAAQPDLTDARRNAESAARNFETRAKNALTELTERATTYNIRHQFLALAHDPDEMRYADEQARLAATELPRYLVQIEQAQREAEEELREHVLHKLREQILNARQTLQRINDALARLDFHGEHYQFRSQPAEETRAYYDLINDSQLVGAGRLFESEFYQTHQAAFEDFYKGLTRSPQTDSEREAQTALSDYRRYLTYDIEVTHPDGRTSRLSKIMDQTSGGETQTPFYLTIAASFVQLYHLNEKHARPTIRLVAFDEAFSKMDQDRIGSTLDLFHYFGLQIITVTPLERCEYLVPKMCTNLVLTAINDRVLIEPYRNYAARLQDTG